MINLNIRLDAKIHNDPPFMLRKAVGVINEGTDRPIRVDQTPNGGALFFEVDGMTYEVQAITIAQAILSSLSTLEKDPMDELNDLLREPKS